MKRPLLLTMLLLIVVALLIPNIYATTTNQPNTEIIVNTSISKDNITVYNTKTANTQSTSAAGSPGAVSDVKSTINSQSTATSTSTSNSSKNQSTRNIQYAQAAAGDSNVQNNWFTNKQITEASGRVKTYIETNKRLPNFVNIGTVQVTMPQFLQLLTTGLIQINKGTTTQIKIKNVGTAPSISENIESGSLKKTGYLNIATSIQSYINNNGRAPNYATSTLGKVGFRSLIYMYSNIMGYHDKNKVLPGTVSLKPWEKISTTTPTNPTPPAGNTSGTKTSFTISQIGKAAGDVKAFVEKNDRLPNFVEINGKNITMPKFLKLLTTSLVQIYGNKLTSIALESAGSPSSPNENVKSGNIDKSGYVDLANRIQKYMDSNGKAPNFASSTLGKIRYETLIYLESRIVYFYAVNKVLPKYAVVNPWETSTAQPSNNQYLRATEDAPSNSRTIINLAKSLTTGKTTEFAKSTAIFNWVRNNIAYSFYYNTVKGALGTLSSKKGNCVDTTHLLVALNRASGIQTRYEHGVCKFADGTFGHVWAQVYVNGQWYRADAISPRNTFGVINNWDTKNWTQIGIYAELSF